MNYQEIIFFLAYLLAMHNISLQISPITGIQLLMLICK